MIMHPVGAEFFQADGRTDRLINETKLIVDFRNFAMRLKKMRSSKFAIILG